MPLYNSRVAGILYLVATPIGNLADITYRAVETLRQTALVACEDTRQTRKLLDHYGIRGRLVSCHDHNEADRSEELLRRLEEGESVALVSDAGTPLVSDPGFRLVRKAVERGVRVVPIPGPSAAVAALCASGLETDRFLFGGFLPRKRGERRKLLEELGGVPATLIFYEAPHRLLDALEDIEAVLGGRPVVVAREVTKLHEEFLRGSAAEVRAELAQRSVVRGESTLLVGRGEARPGKRAAPEDLIEQRRRLEQGGMSRMEAIKRIAREHGLSKREAYRLARDKV